MERESAGGRRKVLSASIDALIPELQPYARQLLAVAGSAGLQPRITSTYRSPTEQARLYRRFLAGQNPYPVAPPGTSAHEFGYAFDMMIMSGPDMNDNLADLGQVWEGWGGVWGGRFKDPIHFEYPGFSEIEKTPQPEALPAQIAGALATAIPGPVGILASVGPAIEGKPLFTYDPKTTIWCRLFGVGCGS